LDYTKGYSPDNENNDTNLERGSLMKILPKPRGYWTFERCALEAKQFKTKKEFSKSPAYSPAHKKGWIDDICSHMSSRRKPNGYWTLKLCQVEALKYTTRVEFENNSPGYQAALKKGWMDQISSHMKIPDYGRYYCVYAIYNQRLNKIYIGITRNKFERRVLEHQSTNNRTNSKEIAQLVDTKYIQITEYKFDVNEIGSHEKQWVVHYIEQGLEVLNSASSIGAIGKTRIFWTFERCQAEAKKYKTKKAFRQVSSSAYTAAQKQGWLEKISSHLTSATKPNGYWTKDKCAAEAKKHGSKAAFKRDASNAYSAALRQGWLEKISSHLTTGKKPNGYWTKAKCHEEALKYSTKKEFKQSCGSAYSTALREGWKDEICQHM
jgi:hypothetical protein